MVRSQDLDAFRLTFPTGRTGVGRTQGLTPVGFGHAGGAAGEALFSLRVRQDPVAPDAHEASGKDMEEKAPKKLVYIEPQGPRWAGPGVVLVPKGDDPLLQGDETTVRDGDPVRVARAVFQDLVRTSEGRLGVDHPLLRTGLEQHLAEGLRFRQRSEIPAQGEAPLIVGSLELIQQLSPEEPTQDPDGEEETCAAVDPPGAVQGQPPGRHHAVEMGMVVQSLSPGVEDGQEADPGSQVSFLGCDIEQGPGHRLEEEVAGDPRVLEGQRPKDLGEGEYDVNVGDGEQLAPLRLHPLFSPDTSRSGGCGRNCRPRAARRSDRMPPHVPECRRPTSDEGGQDTVLGGRAAGGPTECSAMLADQVGHLQGWPFPHGDVNAETLLSVQRTHRASEPMDRDMGVNRRAPETAVTQKCLDQPQIRPPLQEVGGEGVPERMDRDPSLRAQSGRLHSPPARLLDGSGREGAPRLLTREEPARRSGPSTSYERGHHRPGKGGERNRSHKSIPHTGLNHPEPSRTHPGSYLIPLFALLGWMVAPD